MLASLALKSLIALPLFASMAEPDPSPGPRTLEHAETVATIGDTSDFDSVGGNVTFDFGAADLRLGLMPQEATSKPESEAGAAGVASATGGAATDTEALAKAAQNPVADMISVPFQNNFNFNTGPDNQVQWVLNVQPVIPIKLNDDWNVITRTIVPIINQPSPAAGIDSEFGLGDIQFTAFFSPRKPNKIIWGVGPVFQFPTATDDILGQGKWCVGPSVVVLTMHKQWVYGVLANQIWSFAGDEDRTNVSQMLVQPFVNYNLPKGWYLTSAPIITANWKADSDDTWTLPLGGGVGRIMKFGHQPVNIQLSGYWNAIHPDNASNFQIRFQIQLLFPT